MKLNTIDDIEQMARECIDGSIDAKHVWGLPIFDMWAVLTLGALYSCTKLGMIGAKDCAKMKYVVLNRYEMFKTRTVFFEKMYENWIDRTKRFSGKTSELAKLINSGEELNAADVAASALELVDLLTHDDVYLNMFHRRMEDVMFMPHVMQGANRQIDSLMDKFGEKVPYAKLIERFYAATNEDGMAKLFEQLDPDFLKRKARTVPIPGIELDKVAKGVKEVYEERRRA